MIFIFIFVLFLFILNFLGLLYKFNLLIDYLGFKKKSNKKKKKKYCLKCDYKLLDGWYCQKCDIKYWKKYN